MAPARAWTAAAEPASFNQEIIKAKGDFTPQLAVVLRVSKDAGRREEAKPNGPADRRATAPGDPIYAWRDDDIYVHVQGLDTWVEEAKKSGKVPAGEANINNLVVVLNGIPLRGVHPNHHFHWMEAHRDGEEPEAKVSLRKVFYLNFTLARTEGSKAAWRRLLREPDFDPRPVKVSVGFENGETVPIYDPPKRQSRFYFRLVRLPRFFAGAMVILASLGVFLWLARETDLIRDSAVPLRPDGRRPYSLARSQMAFWFFLTLSAFFLLWVLTGSMDTLNTSVLALIGISAGTALGAAFVDAAAGPLPAAKVGRNLPALDLSLPRKEIRSLLKAQVEKAEAGLLALEVQRKEVAPADQPALDANAQAIAAAREDLELLRTQRRYFRHPAWRAVLNDLLAENGLISFHRFQILVWTLVLGVMFVVGVYTELAMPEFSATLLGLLGISGGTYVGFKLTAAQKE